MGCGVGAIETHHRIEDGAEPWTGAEVDDVPVSVLVVVVAANCEVSIFQEGNSSCGDELFHEDIEARDHDFAALGSTHTKAVSEFGSEAVCGSVTHGVVSRFWAWSSLWVALPVSRGVGVVSFRVSQLQACPPAMGCEM